MLPPGGTATAIGLGTLTVLPTVCVDVLTGIRSPGAPVSSLYAPTTNAVAPFEDTPRATGSASTFMGVLATFVEVLMTVSAPVPVGLPALAMVVLATTRGAAGTLAAGTLAAAALGAGPATSVAPASREMAADVAPNLLRPRAGAANTATVSSFRT